MRTNFRRIIFLAFLMLLGGVVCQAEDVVYTDASIFPVYGKVSENTSARYERLPASLEGVSRDPVWRLGCNSAGLYVRFRANTLNLHFRWESTFHQKLDNMTDIGVRGLDLYALTEDGWRYVRTARPKIKVKNNEFTICCGKGEREYMLYLSMYDGVSSLEIGVDKDGTIDQPQVESPKTYKPVIMYGTSILQGASASRSGMAFTNILSRRLDRMVINLGFSGNARLDYEIAEYMASAEDPGVFVLDYAPNCSGALIDEKAEHFFRILRDAHPDVPVIIVENPIYPPSYFDKGMADIIAKRNEAQKRLYDKLVKAGEKKVYYVKAKGMISEDRETAIDGVHFTDIGMVQYTQHILPVIRKALKKNK